MPSPRASAGSLSGTEVLEIIIIAGTLQILSEKALLF